MAAPTPVTTCGLCLEALTTTSYPAGDDLVCTDCARTYIVPLFIESLRFEYKFPAMWRSAPLKHLAYAELLPVGFVIDLEIKQAEYSTPGHQRLICGNRTIARAEDETTSSTAVRPRSIPDIEARGVPLETCDTFLGKLTTDKEITECRRCKGYTCMRCGQPKGPHQPTESDECCEASSPARPPDPLEGLQKGRDYQICPGCGLVGYLGEACNHITCPKCRISYCFLCATRAAHNSRHWTAGSRCPRFGQPNAARPIFDGDVRNGHIVGPVEGLAPDLAVPLPLPPILPSPAAARPIARRNALPGDGVAPPPAVRRARGPRQNPDLDAVRERRRHRAIDDWNLPGDVQDRLPHAALVALFDLQARYLQPYTDRMVADDRVTGADAIANDVWKAFIGLFREGVRGPFDQMTREQLTEAVVRGIMLVNIMHGNILRQPGAMDALRADGVTLPTMELLNPLFVSWRNELDAALAAMGAAP